MSPDVSTAFQVDAVRARFAAYTSGQFADFNPSVACPVDSAPAIPHGPGSMPMNEDEMH